MTVDEAGQLLLLVLADIAIIAVISIGVGAIAPRVPGTWLRHGAGPLLPWETPERYRALGVKRLARRLPEWGAAFGGRSKSQSPGTGTQELRAYLIEVHRAEWVHVVSAVSWLPLLLFNPWWLTLAFAIVVIGVNLPFLAILRHNRARITRMLNGRSNA